MPRRPVVLSLLLALPLLADEGVGMQEVLSKVAPSIATVKIVTQSDFAMGGQSQSRESRSEVQGVVVDEGGLVMISSATFDTSGMKDLFAASGQDGIDIQITPTDFKVVLEQEEKEYEAFLAATDTKLGLAFVQIADLGDRRLAAIGFDGAADPAVGQTLVAVGRMKKAYDYAPFAVTAKVMGQISKPRAAWLLDGDLAGAGLPAFDAAGRVAGVLGDVHVSSSEDENDERGSRLVRRLLGRMGHAEAPQPKFLLPPAPIKSCIEQAKKQAIEVAKERAEKKEAPKAEEPEKKEGAPKEEEAPKDEAPKDGGK